MLCSTHAYQILSAVFYGVNQKSEVSLHKWLCIIAAYPANSDVNEGEKRLQLPSETFKKWPLLVGHTSAIC